MSEFKYKEGDRVDFSWWADNEEQSQGTPGTVTEMTVLDGQRYYLVLWDDGFTEDSDEQNANLWHESVLVPWTDREDLS